MVKITNLKKQNLTEILGNYDIGSYQSKRHVSWALGNTVYFLITSKGKYVLKIFESSPYDLIKFQMRAMKQCAKFGIPVPQIIPTRENQDILTYGEKRIQIMTMDEGIHPKRMNDNLTREIAKNQAEMHNALMKLRLYGKYNWDDYNFNPLKLEIGKIDGFDYKKEDLEVISQLRLIDRRRIRKSVVHGDFHSINLLVKNNKLTSIIDWDDCHEDCLIHDISTLIAHQFIHPNKIDLNRIRMYSEIYQSEIPLNPDEVKALYYFVQKRFLGSLHWAVREIKNHPDHIKRLESHAKKFIAQYRTLQIFGIEEFQRLF